MPNVKVLLRILAFRPAGKFGLLLSLIAPAFFAHSQSVGLPIRFGQSLSDDPHRAAASNEYGSGICGFDSANTAYYRYGDDIVVETQDHRYSRVPFLPAAIKAISNEILHGTPWDGKYQSGSFVQNNLVFDTQDRAYTIIVPKQSNLTFAVLLYSLDRCKTWHAAGLPAGPVAVLESPDTFTTRSGPPSVLVFQNVGATRGNKIWLDMPQFGSDHKLTLVQVLVTENGLLAPNHSGGGNSSITVGQKVFVTYAGASPPSDGSNGASVFVREFDKQAGRWVDPEPVYLGKAGDIVPLAKIQSPDPHDLSAITVDREGILYVGFGSHHGLFKLATSKRPLDITSWTPPEPFGTPFVHDTHAPNNPYAGMWGAYSYLSWNMDRDQNLHVFARCEGDAYRFQLVQLVKPYRRPWLTFPGGLMHEVMVDPGRRDYVAYRQQVSLDNEGNIYLHFVFWPNNLQPNEVDAFGGRDLGRVSTVSGKAKYFVAVPDLYTTTLKSTDEGRHWSIFSAGQ